jgi:hypothetical protein
MPCKILRYMIMPSNPSCRGENNCSAHLSNDTIKFLSSNPRSGVVKYNIYIRKVGCLHPVACTGSGLGFPSNTTLV